MVRMALYRWRNGDRRNGDRNLCHCWRNRDGSLCHPKHDGIRLNVTNTIGKLNLKSGTNSVVAFQKTKDGTLAIGGYYTIAISIYNY